jgi:hypothetical protein
MERPQCVDEPEPDLAGEDSGWSSTTKLTVVPNPSLNAHQQRLVARDFGMRKTKRGWAWSVTLRDCLVPYFAQRYGLIDEPPLDPKKHRIVFVDYELVRHLLAD